MNKQQLLQAFENQFERTDGQCYFSPGRVNLIGEHTDYNGGFVFPCAISLGTYGVIALRDDQMIRMASLNFDEGTIFEFPITSINRKEGHWTDYVKGMIYHLIESGHQFAVGFDLLIYGNLPNGSGLSSSASLEMLIGRMLNDVYRLQCRPIELVSLGKVVENQFIGVNSGIMDQFAVGMGKIHCAIQLDCATLAHQYVPVQMSGHKVLIMNTNKRRELADSKYNERFAETRQALKELQKIVPIQHLCELTAEKFEAIQHHLSSDLIRKRAKHAVTENERVLNAVNALQNNDLETFGKLMNASHVSTENDYEVTGKELDTLVHTAWEQDGVVGARMTGAGFGGCAIALVDETKIDAIQQAIANRYLDVIGYVPSFYVAEIVDGTYYQHVISIADLNG